MTMKNVRNHGEFHGTDVSMKLMYNQRFKIGLS
jgi:hypothetical protein